MEAAALSDVRWPRLQGDLDQLHIGLGSLETKQWWVAVRLSQVSKAVEKVFRDQGVMAKKLEEIERVVTLLSRRPAMADGLHEKATPFGGHGLESMSGGVLSLSPTMCSARQVFAEMSEPCSIHQMFEETPASRPEQEALGTLVAADGAALLVFDEVPHSTVVWDDELQHSSDSHDGLLKQLAGCVDYVVDEEMKTMVQPCIDDKLPHVCGIHLPLELHIDAVSDVFSEMPPEMVTWDEEFQNSLDLHYDGLLQQGAWGRQCMDDELVKWDDDESIVFKAIRQGKATDPLFTF
jgi:hypothetical protein